MPQKWIKAILVSLKKKWNAEDCNNYCRITLLKTVYKILSMVIHGFLTKYVNKIIDSY